MTLIHGCLKNFSKIIYTEYKLTSQKDFFREGKAATGSVMNIPLLAT